METTIIGLFVLVVVGLFIYGIIRLTRYYDKKILENYQRIQQKYPSVHFSKDNIEHQQKVDKDILKGLINEMPFVCFDFVTGTGKSSAYWTTFEFEHGLNLENYILFLANEHFVYKIGKVVNMVQDTQVNIVDFDKRFFIETSNEGVTKQVLTMQIREKMAKIPKLSFGELKIDKTSLIYKVPYSLSTTKGCDYFMNALEFSQELLAELKRIKGKS